MSSIWLSTDLQVYPPLYLNVDMSNPPPGKKSKKLFLLRPFKDLLSSRSRSPSPHEAQLVTTHNASTSISATSAPQVNPQGTSSPSPQGAQSVTLISQVLPYLARKQIVVHLYRSTHKAPNIRQSSSFPSRLPARWQENIEWKSGGVLHMKGWK